jgi:nicotinate-nucleotide adenylyltransferase
MKWQRIGVYGGTFDPVHRGHLSVARAVRENFNLDELLFVPAFVPPHKRGREISLPQHRYAMLALATRHEPQMRISTIELDAPARPYTVETMASLQTQYADADLFFVMGMDSFREVTLWRDYETLLTTYGIIVAARPSQDNRYENDDEAVGKHLAPALQSRVVDLRGGQRPTNEQLATPQIFVTDYVAVDVSATAIRAAVEEGQGIEALVPSAVAAYVQKYSLYRD